MIGKFLYRNRVVLLYGTSLAVLLALLKWLELRFVIYDHAFEAYIGAIALLFTSLGIWLALKITRPKVQTVVVEKHIRVENGAAPDADTLARLGISQRELEVLGLMAAGLSNQQIADRIFVSLNTVKTHSSRIFEKLDVQRRTQAVEKGRQLGLI